MAVQLETVFSVQGPYAARLEWFERRTIRIVVTPTIDDDSNGAHFRDHLKQIDSWRGAGVRVVYVPVKQQRAEQP